MDESAHTFGPMAASVSSHYRGRGGSPVMITDALSDVRVNYHIELKELGHGHYGVVRKCYNRETGACYAIKVRLCCSTIVVAILSLAIHTKTNEFPVGCDSLLKNQKCRRLKY
jgi:hypothetical protein